MLPHALLATLLSLLFTNPISTVDITSNASLIAALITANSQLDRLALLPDDATDWHFDFTIQKNYNFAPGGVINMNAATFPAAKGNRMTRKHPFLPKTDERRCSPQGRPAILITLPPPLPLITMSLTQPHHQWPFST